MIAIVAVCNIINWFALHIRDLFMSVEWKH